MTATSNGAPVAEKAVGLVVLAAIALLLFAKPLVRNEVLTLRDHSDYFQPLRLFTGQELRRGHLPLWNPYNASGEPWLANPQTGVFYPPTWIFLVVPFATAYTLFLALHVALLGCGAFLLFRRVASPAGALLGALSLMLCGPSLSLLDISNTLTTFAWIPLVLWCAVSMASPGMCAVVLTMSFLAGEPFFAAVGALMFVVLRRKNIVDIGLTSLALSSIQLFPFLASLSGSDRAGNIEASEVLRDSMSLGDWLHVFIGGAPHQQFVPVVYVGVVASILTLVAVAAGWRRRAVRYALALLGAAAIVAAGSYLRPVGIALTHLPVTILRYPARMVPMGALAIAALAAVGWDAVARVASYRWLPVILAGLIVADLTPAIAPLMQSAPFNPHPTPYDVGIARDSKMIRLLQGRTFDRRAWISGYQNLFDRRFDSWTAAPVVSETYARAYAEAPGRQDILNGMSIGYVMSDRPFADARPIARAGNVSLYRNRTALPLAYWRGDDGHTAPPAILAFTTAAVHVTIDAPGDGVVIVTQQNANGWRVSVDDVPAQSEPGGIFRAVRVKRGHHAIAWRYRPPSIVAGAIVTVIGLSRLILSSIFVKRRARKLFFRNALESAASGCRISLLQSTFSHSV